MRTIERFIETAKNGALHTNYPSIDSYINYLELYDICTRKRINQFFRHHENTKENIMRRALEWIEKIEDCNGSLGDGLEYAYCLDFVIGRIVCGYKFSD